MLCKFKEVILICDPNSKDIFKKMFSNGKYLGMKIIILIQKSKWYSRGLSGCKGIYKKQNVCLILGDNFFYGQGFYESLKKGINLKKGAFFSI